MQIASVFSPEAPEKARSILICEVGFNVRIPMWRGQDDTVYSGEQLDEGADAG